MDEITEVMIKLELISEQFLTPEEKRQKNLDYREITKQEIAKWEKLILKFPQSIKILERYRQRNRQILQLLHENPTKTYAELVLEFKGENDDE